MNGRRMLRATPGRRQPFAAIEVRLEETPTLVLAADSAEDEERLRRWLAASAPRVISEIERIADRRAA